MTDNIIPTLQDLEKHAKLIWGPAAVVQMPEENIIDFGLKIEGRGEDWIGGIYYEKGWWKCYRYQSDSGNRDTPPDTWDVEIPGMERGYWYIIRRLYLALQEVYIDHAIESISEAEAWQEYNAQEAIDQARRLGDLLEGDL